MYYTPTSFQTRKIEERLSNTKIRLEAIESVRKVRNIFVCDSKGDFLENLQKYVTTLSALIGDEINLTTHIIASDVISTKKLIEKVEEKINNAKKGWIVSLEKVKENIIKKYLKKFCSNADIETFIYDVVYRTPRKDSPAKVRYEEIKRIYTQIHDLMLSIYDENGDEIRGSLAWGIGKITESKNQSEIEPDLSRNSVASSQRPPTELFDHSKSLDPSKESLNSIGISNSFLMMKMETMYIIEIILMTVT